MGEAAETQEQADKRLKGLGFSHLTLWHCCCSSSLLVLPKKKRHLQILSLVVIVMPQSK